MIPTLQKKFVLTAMAAITVLLLCLLGAINIANLIITEKQIQRTLYVVAENAGKAEDVLPLPENPPPKPSIQAPKNEYDTIMSANFFVVQFDANGTVLAVDVNRTSAVTEEQAVTLAEEIYHQGNSQGKIGKFRYSLLPALFSSGSVAVFLDTTGELFSYFRVLLLSVGIGLLCWGLMLIFVILLSRKAIRPIAENMEKQKQFVTNAGHEIKTPLAIIQSNTEAMVLYQGENKWSKNILAQTTRLNGLMNNLLTLARMGPYKPSMFRPIA